MKTTIKYHFLLYFFLIPLQIYGETLCDIHFEIIIPSYNNEKWCVQNLQSVLSQKYPSFHVTYINDCSTDNTGKIVTNFLNTQHAHKNVTLIHNTQRKGALENLFNTIQNCNDNSVIVTVDGDDMLADDEVLQYLANIYEKYNVWLTYGQFKEWPLGGIGWCQAMPEHIILGGKFREWQHIPSHLRTFYAWLFKKIDYHDLIYKGKFYQMTWDQAMMFPMIEMAGKRHAFISRIMYLYNTENSINDHKVDGALQAFLAREIRKKCSYQCLPDSHPKNIQKKPFYVNSPQVTHMNNAHKIYPGRKHKPKKNSMHKKQVMKYHFYKRMERNK